jgi:ATP-dependent DNA helicase RecG
MQGFFDTPIEFLKGVGPAKAELLKKELAIATFGDLIQHYPFRYEDRTQFHRISAIGDAQGYVQVKGQIRHVEMAGSGRKKRLVAQLHDQSGQLELVWFTSSAWIAKRLQTGIEYVVYGKPNRFKGKYSLAHPEIEPLSETKEAPAYLHPVYPSTEKLRVRFLDSKGIANLQKQILKDAQRHIYENPATGTQRALQTHLQKGCPDKNSLSQR